MLQTKYKKLKKKVQFLLYNAVKFHCLLHVCIEFNASIPLQKKQLQALKAPKTEPEKPIVPKRPAEARDAREFAKKLIKSGQIRTISKVQKRPEQTFKRPRGITERKKHPFVFF